MKTADWLDVVASPWLDFQGLVESYLGKLELRISGRSSVYTLRIKE